MTTTLVTGGAGFIGAQLAARLAARGERVVIFDDFNSGLYPAKLKRDRVKALLVPRQVTVVEGDIRDETAVGKLFAHRFDRVCHLAAWAGVGPSLKDPHTYETVNITGTRIIFAAAVAHAIPRVVYASSSSIYGANTKLPFSETDRTDNPVGPYAMTKKTNELQAFYYHHVYGLKSVGLRFFTVYGPWGRPDMALFIFMDKIRRGKPLIVNNYGKMKRNFTYVDDIVDGLVASLDSDFNYETFNLGAGATVTLEEYIAVIEKTMGQKAKKDYRPMPPGEVADTIANVAKAKKLLGYWPKVKIEEGIPRAWTWYKEYYGV